MSELNGFWSKVFSEGGEVSAMRLFFVCAFFMFYPAFCGVWAFTSVQGGELKDIPQGVIWLLGVLLLGKLWQKAIEGDKPNVG